MKSILITGCNRGLGLGLVKSLLKQQNTPNYIIATCRNSQKEKELKELASTNKNLYILYLDVKDFASYENFAKQVENIVKDNGLNVLFNNAGTSTKFTRLNMVKEDQLMDCFATNTVGPIMLTKALHPLLKKASENNASQPLGISRAAVINMSSILGSVGSNSDGGYYPYRCSKSALNAATKSLSCDLKKDGILAAALHPGWVQTDMGGSKAPLDVETSVSGILKTIQSLNENNNGGFLQFDGKELPW